MKRCSSIILKIVLREILGLIIGFFLLVGSLYGLTFLSIPGYPFEQTPSSAWYHYYAMELVVGIIIFLYLIYSFFLVRRALRIKE